MKTIEKLLEEAQRLPELSGCYLMKNHQEKIIYIGKAKNLKNRVSSYFNQSTKENKTMHLVSHIQSFEFILTQNESEAYLLENTLIKKHLPKYNIRLKDDSSYPYAVIDCDNDFPRLLFMRRPSRHKHRLVFGPYTQQDNIGEVIDYLNKILELRQCTLREFKQRKTACLLHQIQQCSAPCVDLIEVNSYEEKIKKVKSILLKKGKNEIAELKNQMNLMADKEEFERAAFFRDAIEVLEGFTQRDEQQFAEISSLTLKGSIDLVHYNESDKAVDFALYHLQDGKLVGQYGNYFSKKTFYGEKEIEEQVISLLLEYYLYQKNSAPDILLSPFHPERQKNLLNVLSHHFHMTIQKQSKHKTLQKMLLFVKDVAKENQDYRFRMRGQHGPEEALFELQTLINLSEIPLLIDCLDTAVLQGDSPTGSAVRFKNGLPQKEEYRFFNLESPEKKNNDFDFIKQALEKSIALANFPDLYVVDGGKGQVSVAQQVLQENNLNIPVIGIAKEKNAPEKGERLIIPGAKGSYPLRKGSALYRLLTQMRNEAHRFCRVLHHKREKKRFFS